ncbi:MAG: actinodefensin-associated protein B [Solirubrobacteraceae bacterium]
MSVCAALPEHVILRELPFCGVLLDTRTSRVYRLSQPATAMLRRALDGTDAPGPYEPVIRTRSTASASAPALGQLIARLASAGLLRVVSPSRSAQDERDAS